MRKLITATGGAPSSSSASVISRPIQGCTPRVLKKLPDTYSPLRVSACARDPALRTPSGALPACSAARLMNSGVCARKFLYASQENSEKFPSSPWVYPPQLQQRILSPILHNSSGFVTGSDFSITWCTSVKMAVVAPMPSASVITAVVVTAGVFRSCRSASRKSPSTGSSDFARCVRHPLPHYGTTPARVPETMLRPAQGVNCRERPANGECHYSLTVLPGKSYLAQHAILQTRA